MSVAWLFPGQGAQRKGMGAEVFDRFPELCRQADEILGWSVRAQCLDGAGPGLDDTRHVQPALFVVNALTFLARGADGSAPDFLAGHSLGEYDALFAAGCFDFAAGVRMVQRRGELMGRASGGGMLAVVGAASAELEAFLKSSGFDAVDIANCNSAVQTVLSGPLDDLKRAAAAIRAEGLGRGVPLRVSAPFHSRYMASAAEEFGGFLAGIPFAEPRIPVIANVTGRPYPADGVRELLLRQIESPVRWWESMSYLLARGVTDIVEAGPGQILTDLWTAAVGQPHPVEPQPPQPEPAATPAARPATTAITAERLGSAEFREDYGVRYAYLAGSMFKGIASTELVIRMSRAGLLGFFGSGGLSLGEIEAAIRDIRAALGPDGRFGMNLLAALDDPAADRETAALYLRHDIRHIEAAAYTGVTAGLVHFRFHGARRLPGGEFAASRFVVAKVSRPEVAAAFMSPAPDALIDRLVADGALTEEEAAAARSLPVASDVCVEADSGGHTDAGNLYALLPAMARMRDAVMAERRYPRRIRVGAAGGLGAPDAVAAAFVLGADFVVTGSVNQCTPEAGTSDAVKDLLATVDVQDTAYAPAGDMFELGARVQVIRKGTLFAARANKLHQVYRTFPSLDAIDPETRRTIEERYFRRSFAEVWDETREYLRKHRAQDVERAERDPKAKMALVFRWYFVHTTRMAMSGAPHEKVNYQIHCGPALGAFNRAVAGTPLEPWRARHVDAVAELLMAGAADVLDRTLHRWAGTAGSTH
jgi:trans-AT polyketide synthase/acyltransferase/oxidoreductase domain-containing protein